MADSNLPGLIVYVSGKRCSGKTYICRWLSENVPSCAVFELMELLGHMYAAHARVPVHELSLRDTKETHRVAMLDYYKTLDEQTFKCAAINRIRALAPMPFALLIDVWHPSQRRMCGGVFPGALYRHLRVEASDETRARRGWVRPAVDDDVTEAEIDALPSWAYAPVNNDTDGDEVCQRLKDSCLRVYYFP